MKFQRFLKEYRELRIHHRNERSHLGFCSGATHAGVAHMQMLAKLREAEDASTTASVYEQMYIAYCLHEFSG